MMEFKFGLTIAVLLAIATKGHSQLQCYVCDNCAKIDKNTPLEACGPDAATTTTTMTTPPVTTTTVMSTNVDTSSTADSTTHITGPPTPATVGPISSTTSLPTPPSVDGNPLDIDLRHNSTAHPTTPPTLFVTPSVVTTTTDDAITVLPSSNMTSNATSVPSTLLVRQRRNIPENGMTYHCYKVQKKYDNVYGVQRGCMGVLTQQSVCGELKAANNNQTHKCQPCSTSKCNGSSTIGVSIATLLVALVAVIYKV